MKKSLRFISLILCFANINAQYELQLQNIKSKNTPWTTDIVNDNEKKFNFVVVTDRTGGERKGVWEKGIKKTYNDEIKSKRVRHRSNSSISKQISVKSHFLKILNSHLCNFIL